MRETLICCCIRSSVEAAKRACCSGSRTNALTTLIPARFSWRIVFRRESLICTCINIGWAIRPKIMKMAKASGSTGRMTSVSRGLVSHSRMSAPVRRRSAWATISSPWPMNMRTFSTSSVARIMSWPV